MSNKERDPSKCWYCQSETQESLGCPRTCPRFLNNHDGARQSYLKAAQDLKQMTDIGIQSEDFFMDNTIQNSSENEIAEEMYLKCA